MKIDKVALVQCPEYDIDAPPPGIAYLSSYLRSKGYKTKIFDFNIELYNNTFDKSWWKRHRAKDWIKKNEIKKFEFFSEKIFLELAKKVLRYKPLAVCFSVYDTSALFTIKIAKKIKKLDRKCVIIFGGPAIHVKGRKLSISHLEKYADILIQGEGEQTLHHVLKNLKRIKDCKKPVMLEGELIQNLDKLPIPSYEEFDLNAYRLVKYGFIRAVGSRGCPNRCAFCFEQPYWRIYRTRDPKEIVKEFGLRKKQGIKKIYFSDTTINGDIKKLNLLCDELIKRKIGISWGGNANISSRMTYKLLRHMKKAGCIMLDYGAESASKKVLKLMNKNITPLEISKTVIKTRLIGIKMCVNWIVGFPNETWLDFFKTIFFIILHRPFIDMLCMNMCAIKRNSSLDKESETFNIQHNNWGHEHDWITKNKKNYLAIRKKRADIIMLVSSLLRYQIVGNLEHKN